MTQKSVLWAGGVGDINYCVSVRFSQSERRGLLFPNCDREGVGYGQPYREVLIFHECSTAGPQFTNCDIPAHSL
jgi:hypothetical protein